MDSDSDYVDDLTESYYYQTDPYTFNPNFVPSKTSHESTILFQSINKFYSCFLIVLAAIETFIRKKRGLSPII